MRLAGVEIPAAVHLIGHSDGDAVCHAVTDAILGGAALGDIGTMFPDTDAANTGRDSLEMLAAAVDRARMKGWHVVNVDVAVVTEVPKLAPHRDLMRDNLSRVLGVGTGAVSIKGKTNELMGWIGRGEGLACIAVATITRKGGE
ncbi:MAG: 2-C-methyl-D-erythritol 2,4-cyclodiphosphate synthase [Gemmatimonadota bacterium]|nr:2-C-methyl-D-erythritol 2,4-cyclodiphosphate synthase [Gemmatimonadota bacterium]